MIPRMDGELDGSTRPVIRQEITLSLESLNSTLPKIEGDIGYVRPGKEHRMAFNNHIDDIRLFYGNALRFLR
jgi:hypothetical protein